VDALTTRYLDVRGIGQKNVAATVRIIENRYVQN
jgi:hypothetical protein